MLSRPPPQYLDLSLALSQHGAVATMHLREPAKQPTPRGQAERPPLAPQTADADVPCAYEARGRAGSVLEARW